jgi:hypothetical protein
MFNNGNRCDHQTFENSDFCGFHTRDAGFPGKDENARHSLEEMARQEKSLEGFNLQQLNLHDISLIGADLENADFSRANLSYSHLYGANLKGANFFKTDLTGANLRSACLEDVNLLGANLDKAKFDMAHWNKDFIIINEKEGIAAEKKNNRQSALEKYKEAEEIYRNIKLSLRDQGHSRDESPFFHREKIMQRKQMPIFSPGRIFSKVMDMTTGYGEKPLNVLTTMAFDIFMAAIFYGLFGVQQGDKILSFGSKNPSGLMDTLGNLIYFSCVVFTTVGFGDILPSGFSKFIMMFQALSGQILIAFFIVALYKKSMSR